MASDPQGAETPECDGCEEVRPAVGRYLVLRGAVHRSIANYCQDCVRADSTNGYTLETITRYPLPPHAGEETKG